MTRKGGAGIVLAVVKDGREDGEGSSGIARRRLAFFLGGAVNRLVGLGRGVGGRGRHAVGR